MLHIHTLQYPCHAYEEEDTCYTDLEEEDTCYTYTHSNIPVTHMRRRIHVTPTMRRRIHVTHTHTPIPLSRI